jgi:hypothetical protein
MVEHRFLDPVAQSQFGLRLKESQGGADAELSEGPLRGRSRCFLVGLDRATAPDLSCERSEQMTNRGSRTTGLFENGPRLPACRRSLRQAGMFRNEWLPFSESRRCVSGLSVPKSYQNLTIVCRPIMKMLRRCRHPRISMWRHEAAHVYVTIIFHVRASACHSGFSTAGRLDAAGSGGSHATSSNESKFRKPG